MKVHYFNILFFSLPLNILENTYTKPHTTPSHTKTIRLLCESDLYMPNYDNDPQMKKIMENFNKQTQQRLREYDESLHAKRKSCKEHCDKEIHKIILKDKLEKELMDKFATLHTDIQRDAIPTCVCEKSLADKMEKTCLRCGEILGSAMPELGAIGGTVVYASAQSAAMEVFISETIEGLKLIGGMTTLFGEKTIAQFVTPEVFGKPMPLYTTILSEKEKLCACPKMGNQLLCSSTEIRFAQSLPGRVGSAVNDAVHIAKEKFAAATTPTTFLTNPLILSSIAILVIVLIMVIIYLILRYRRKKKMKKKLQYIKLLEE
ncbi:PIR protein [Plasmodium sp. DRC-Itaito]|nr:PIR protein [Plasmodium sp. DRC-Itaito]